MLTKGKITLFMTLCILSLVSIGFASWTISEESKEEVLGSMQTDNVINSADFIYLDTSKGENLSGISCFKYQELGYLAENDTYVYQNGFIYNYYVLDVERCYSIFGSNSTSININISLGYADNVSTEINLFEYSPSTDDIIGYRDFSSSLSVTTANVSGTMKQVETENPVKYVVSVSFDNILTNYKNGSCPAKVYFYVKYSLFATPGNYFKNYIYPYLFKNDINVISFKVDVSVSSK